MNKPSSFAERLCYLMAEKGLSKSELAKLSGIDRSNITRYCKGDYEAKQDVVYLMSARLGVDPAWLMGYDVPKEPSAENQALRSLAEQTVEENLLLECWRKATEEQKRTIAFILRDYGMSL